MSQLDRDVSNTLATAHCVNATTVKPTTAAVNAPPPVAECVDVAASNAWIAFQRDMFGIDTAPVSKAVDVTTATRLSDRSAPASERCVTKPAVTFRNPPNTDNCVTNQNVRDGRDDENTHNGMTAVLGHSSSPPVNRAAGNKSPRQCNCQ